jgi:hypothetical protein
VNVADALMVAEIGCESGILTRRALVALGGEVHRLQKLLEEAGIEAAPQAEREEMEGATA